MILSPPPRAASPTSDHRRVVWSGQRQAVCRLTVAGTGEMNMTTREIDTATRLLEAVGRRVTGTICDERGNRPTTAIETDGDGTRQPSGTPRVFSTLESVREYCDNR